MEKDLSQIPMTLTLANTSTEEATSFRYFRVNFTEVLQPEDTVTSVAQSSEEAAYYLALNDEDKHLAVEIAE